MVGTTLHRKHGNFGKNITGIDQMLRAFIRIVIVAVFGVSWAYADTSIPRFDDFPANSYHGKIAPVRIVSMKDRQFKSRLRELSGQKPNFAGHYRLATWGCGASCVTAVAIDAESGRTVWLPFTVCCWDVDIDDPIKFKVNSRLIEIHGSRNEAGGGTYYYALDNDGFTLIKAVEKAAK
jgi:hypothetical protein